MEQIRLRTLLTEAIKFWEPARFIYNAMLLAVLFYFIGRSGAWGALGHSEFLANVIALAVAANFAYTMAYLPDMALRFSLLSQKTKRFGTGLIFILGMIIAFTLCRFISEELVRAYAWAS